VTPFEFIAAFFSIIFGLALTHILSGAAQLIHKRRGDFIRLIYAAFLALVIILNWWVAFAWRDHQGWTFDAFLLLILWAISFYAAAIALFPHHEQDDVSNVSASRDFLRVFLAVLMLDRAATAIRTGLFSPWYYLVFVGHYAVLAILALSIKNVAFQRGAALWFLVSVLTWSLVVRRFLS
jgi:hypothetical protein